MLTIYEDLGNLTNQKSNQHIPAYVEVILLWRYFELYGGLPAWNKEF